MSYVPLLSYAEARSSTETFVASLRKALSTVGFFVLTDIDAVFPAWREVWDKAFEVSGDFFALPEEEKEAISMIHSRHFRGFAGVGEEVTMGKKDLREQIDMGPDSEPIVPYPPTPDNPIEHSLYGPNLYPPTLPTFAPAIKAYRAHCEGIAKDLIAAIAASLTPKPDLITSLFEADEPGKPGYSRLKVVRYPGLVDGIEGLGCGAHKDGGGLTLLATDGTPGLQVQRWDGRWEDAAHIPYALVINNGQVIERLSASLFPATTHRVLPPPSPRLSIPFFFCPPLTKVLTPLTRDQLHPELCEQSVPEEVSEVKAGDLHEEVFGRSTWRGVSRSHGVCWEKWYGEWDRVGGPVVVA